MPPDADAFRPGGASLDRQIGVWTQKRSPLRLLAVYVWGRVLSRPSSGAARRWHFTAWLRGEICANLSPSRATYSPGRAATMETVRELATS
jgi:hypothetical protein